MRQFKPAGDELMMEYDGQEQRDANLKIVVEARGRGLNKERVEADLLPESIRRKETGAACGCRSRNSYRHAWRGGFAVFRGQSHSNLWFQNHG